MIPPEVLNPRDYWTPIATRQKAEALAERYAVDDYEAPGTYTVEEKGAAFAIAYYEDGEFIAYV
ncbi:hypothetical protein CcrC1_gp006 [Caulobacter phage C1]|nr:hypothetical protein CcrC1_gp499 [Caulobacter phage C1]UTU08234.1 hypothetical protein CcrC2_gp484 [Caulobacter phage C2]UTU08757.1 hypothetical protein CcrJ4_gp497 [Caulobacter phage J4]UTU09293.1 hypothetical protein CcrBL47_gp523 [Caulobacter phage BL47]UTU09869.1 hypothetical protein CcrRB23_gp502 [Caulobacter phage RB23]WGN96893.1 hypothetical protein [Bertelyvirus sp.]